MADTTIRGPRTQWWYRFKHLLSFFQGERRRGISALFMRFSEVKFAEIQCLQ